MVQIVEQTKEEKLAMYMKLTKKELAEMLINCNEIIDKITPVISYHGQQEMVEVRNFPPNNDITYIESRDGWLHLGSNLSTLTNKNLNPH